MGSWKGMATKLKSPCHKCEDRVVGCHGRCPKYKKYREEYDKLNDKEKIAKLYSHMANDPKHFYGTNKTRG